MRRTYYKSMAKGREGRESKRDMKRWRKIHRVPNDAKVFISSNNYPALVEELLDRGWVRN